MLSRYNMTIKSVSKNYSVNFVDSFIPELKNELKDGDVLIIDIKLKEYFDFNQFENKQIFIEATELQKSYTGIIPVIRQLIDIKFKKDNKLIAIGGGITQDVAAFISSIIYRGTDWVFIPTTLLAQGDSCIGGKTSINFENYKNQLGNFNPPNKIFIDISFLKSLSEKEYRSGIGEMCHFFLVSGNEDFDIFKSNFAFAIERDSTSVQVLISNCLRIKKSFVELDEFDKKERKLLNYGHSFGHAIESVTDFGVPHGIAVTYGMDIANFVSWKLNFISEIEYHDIRKVLKSIWGNNLPQINVDELIEALKKDKKNSKNNIRVILTEGIGRMFIHQIDDIKSFKDLLEDYFLDFKEL